MRLKDKYGKYIKRIKITTHIFIYLEQYVRLDMLLVGTLGWDNLFLWHTHNKLPCLEPRKQGWTISTLNSTLQHLSKTTGILNKGIL